MIIVLLISIPLAFALGAYWLYTVNDLNNDKKILGL